jgi:hypothetical protein
LIALVVLAAAGTGRAAGPCEAGRVPTGLALGGAGEGTVAVAAVDADSPAAAGGIRVGDAVVQVNGTVVRSCGEYARTVRDARRDKKAVLLLVRRGGAECRSSSPPPPGTAPSRPRAHRCRASRRASGRSSPRRPPPLPPETSVSVDEVTHGLTALDAADRPTGRLALYRRDLLRLHRQVETLAARASAPPRCSGAPHRARLLRCGGRRVGQRGGAPRARSPAAPIPSRGNASAPYFEDSDVAAVIDEFPFLRETVVRDPQPGPVGVESAGLWRPLEARALLWQRGRDELGRLTGWLGGGPVAGATR